MWLLLLGLLGLLGKRLTGDAHARAPRLVEQRHLTCTCTCTARQKRSRLVPPCTCTHTCTCTHRPARVKLRADTKQHGRMPRRRGVTRPHPRPGDWGWGNAANSPLGRRGNGHRRNGRLLDPGHQAPG